MCQVRVHTGAKYTIPLNRPCAAMRPVVKLLSPFAVVVVVAEVCNCLQLFTNIVKQRSVFSYDLKVSRETWSGS